MSTRPVAPQYPLVSWIAKRTPRQRYLGMGLFGIGITFFVARFASGLILDRLWFTSLGASTVWTTKTGAQLLLAVVAAVVSGVLLIGSAVLALRVQPAPGNTPNRLVLRYRERMGPAHRWLVLGAAVYVSARMAWAAMSHWQPWLLFLHGPNLSQPVPDIGWDLGYHLFRLPFLQIISNWMRGLLLITAGITLTTYVANGAFKFPRSGRRSASRAKRHLAVLATAFAWVQALDYLFVRWPANGTNRYGAFDGPGFTELRIVIPALWFLAAMALLAGSVALWATVGSRFRPVVVMFGAWGLVHVFLLGAVPAIVTRLVVEPAEAVRQIPYIGNNLDATRTAFSLDAVTQVTETVSDGLEVGYTASSESVDRVPLFGEDQLIAPLQVLQGTTGTRVTDVDLDRYEIDGDVRPVLIAARNANRADLPEPGWVQQHLVYTHGDGVVAVPADSTSSDGRPDVDALAKTFDPDRSELYFGEGLAGWYAIVGTQRTELGGESYASDAGIPMSNAWRRTALALATGDIEPVLSAELTSGSQLLYRRDIKERLGTLAPWLSIDANPYPVVADGRITWIVDGYTTASTYPHSQFAQSAELSSSSDLSQRTFNYLHASIKATVDAYDGTVHLYRTEVGGSVDPVLDAWATIFPGLIEPISTMPASIRAHLLYPQDMFVVQTDMLGRYHVPNAETLFSGAERWAVSASAGAGVARSSKEDDPANAAAPVSLFMPPGEMLGGHWVAIRPFGPGSASNPTSTRDELSAYAIADHDDPERLVLVRIAPRPGRLVSSPKVAQASIDTDKDLAALFTLLNANGSAVQFGPMTPVPVDGALVWVRSIVVTGTADTTAPRLHGVAAVSNGLVGEADTVEAALDRAVGAAPG